MAIHRGRSVHRRQLAIAIGVTVMVAAAAAGTRLSTGTSLRTPSQGGLAGAVGERDRGSAVNRNFAKAPSFANLSSSVSKPIVITARRRDTSPALHSIPSI